MRFSDQELRGLPVVTKAGDRIGKVSGLVVDGANHAVAHYVVAKSRSLSALLPKELLVSPAQVVAIDEEKMTVKGEFIAVEAAEAVAVGGKQAANAAVSSLSRSVKS